MNEPIKFQDCNSENCGMRFDVVSKQRRCSNMFTKSKNWKKNDEDNTFTCMYMVGNNIEINGIHQIEIKEFQITLSYAESQIKLSVLPR